MFLSRQSRLTIGKPRPFAACRNTATARSYQAESASAFQLTVLSQAIEAMRPSDIGELMVMDAYNTGQRLYVLLQRGLVEKPDKKRGAYRITQEGQKYLDNPPPEPTEKMAESDAKRGDESDAKRGDKSDGVKIVEKPPAMPPVPPLAPPPTPPPVTPRQHSPNTAQRGLGHSLPSRYFQVHSGATEHFQAKGRNSTHCRSLLCREDGRPGRLELLVERRSSLLSNNLCVESVSNEQYLERGLET